MSPQNGGISLFKSGSVPYFKSGSVPTTKAKKKAPKSLVISENTLTFAVDI